VSLISARWLNIGDTVAAEIGDDSSVSYADILGVLARIENDHPDLAAAALIHEVDSLLGREPTSTRPAMRTTSREQKRSRSPGDSAFAWYQPIAAALPAVMVPEATIAAAKAVEAGLLAEEKLVFSRSAMTVSHMDDLQMLMDEGQEAFHLLIVSNLRLVFYWSKGVMAELGQDWVQDAFQAGCFGLIRGIQGWDYKMGYTLSTYVTWHIRQSIQRWRWNDVALIRLPVHVWERLHANSDGLSTTTDAAVLRALNIVRIEDIAEDSPVLICDDDIDEIARHAEINRLVTHLLARLTEREAQVLKLRHGLGGVSHEPMTLEAIGRVIGVTRERIRQIEDKAVKKLRNDPMRAALVDLL
jgi:RNA polymerase sigma factor (sigma-70 family)